MSFLVIVFSSVMASLASRSLRIRLVSRAAWTPATSPAADAASISTFLTYCWVSVEPPWTSVVVAFFTAARTRPCGSMPPCS